MLKRTLLALAPIALAAAAGVGAPAAHAGYYTCNGRVVQGSMCPNHEPAVFQAGELPAPENRPWSGGRTGPASAGGRGGDGLYDPRGRGRDPAWSRRPDPYEAGGGTFVAQGPPLCSDPNAFPYKPGHYTCNGRLSNAATCPNGEPAMYHAELIQACRATPVRYITREEMAQMDRRLDARARELARRWTASGRLSPAQVNAIRTGNCLIMGASNPDVTCVLGTPF